MSDKLVLETQKWLNKTYSGVAGYQKVVENGNTGWSTIYALREGLQHELGISPVSSGFGDTTSAAVDKIISKLKVGYSGNIVKLIQGAFWAKGYSPASFDGKYTADTKSAVELMQTDAGLVADGKITTNFMRALFDMSAFTLILGGNATVRSMQQYLNANYQKYFGILPTDGIYQRDTNTALIYAFQDAIGLGNVANGFYGPGTINATPTLHVGDKGEVIKILQYGLMVNGYYTGVADGKFTSSLGEEIIAFRKFMNLPPYTNVADLTVLKGLLTSNGNTLRDASVMDTSRQLSTNDVAMLKSEGYKVIGRYLTGSVGVGDNERPKNMTKSEVKLISKAGMHIFPIYQDGGATLSYFTAKQGMEDAMTASRAARALGFPKDTVIYFASDLDIQAGDIDGTVIPYFQAISKNISGFQVGIYGTRNVTNQVITVGGADYAFVSDMSTGFSGNLGYPMPKRWSFDQFVEFQLNGVPIDNVGMSGLDAGVSAFNPIISAQEALKNILGFTDITLDGPSVTVVDSGALKITAHASSHVNETDGSHIIGINNGKIDSVKLESVMTDLGFSNVSASLEAWITKAGMSLSGDFADGDLNILSFSSDGKVAEIEIIIKSLQDHVLDAEFSIVFEIELDPSNLEGKAKEIFESMIEGAEKVAVAVVIAAVVVLVALMVIFFGAEALALLAEIGLVLS